MFYIHPKPQAPRNPETYTASKPYLQLHATACLADPKPFCATLETYQPQTHCAARASCTRECKKSPRPWKPCEKSGIPNPPATQLSVSQSFGRRNYSFCFEGGGVPMQPAPPSHVKSWLKLPHSTVRPQLLQTVKEPQVLPPPRKANDRKSHSSRSTASGDHRPSRLRGGCRAQKSASPQRAGIWECFVT